jgi:hypothetical protein
LLLEQFDVVRIGKVAALIAVHDFWFLCCKRPFEACQNKRFVNRTGQFVIDDFAAVPVDDDEQIHESFVHANVRDVNAPHLIRPDDVQVPQQVRMHILRVVTLAEIGLWIHSLQTHVSHQATHAFAINVKAFLDQFRGHPAITEIRMCGVQFIDLVHDFDVFLGFAVRALGTIRIASVNAQQLALAPNTDVFVIPFDHGQPFRMSVT